MRNDIYATLNDIDRHLLDAYQRDFPLSSTPYADIARELGIGEDEVLSRLQRLLDVGAVSRIGAVLRPRTVGASTLAAIAVPPERLAETAAIVSSYPEVNHNYEREHELNLWFVAAAADEANLEALLAEIEARTGLVVHRLPMIEDYHIDLGFKLKWA